uniref:bestrophin family protein n=1 Tax=Aquimarina pacifica TaxID=1296415 RepID=UPI0021CDAA28|nr:bestrophin family ion channel [Aquimarina pacifica]
MVKWDILITSIFSTIIHFLSIYVYTLNLPITLGAFLGTSIALLLSFKLSQSYDRWWESRKIWGSIVNDSRTLMIQVLNLSKEDSEIHKEVGYRQIAWCYSLGQSLRKQDPFKNLDSFLSEEELKRIQHHKNIPLILLNNQAEDIKKLFNKNSINEYQQIQIDNTIVRLTASMGMAERIKNTVFPKSYRLTLQFFIYLFLVLLSFALTELPGFIEIPLLVIIALPFFLLEKIAFNMQDPFENKPTDTAMTAISRTIEINIKQLLGQDKIPDALDSNKFYIL